MQKSISTQEDIEQLIIDIEQKWPVDLWNINGIDIWPYVRIKIYIDFLVQMNKSNVSTDSNKQTEKKKSNFLVRIFLMILKITGAFVRLVAFFLRLKNKKILFFGSHIHRVLNDEVYFNRFYDSMIEHHKLEDEVYMVEYQKTYDKMYNPNAVIELKKHLNDFTLLSKLFSGFRKNKNTVHLEGYEEFHLWLSAHFFELKRIRISEKELINWTNKIKSLKPFYRLFYKIVKPSKIVFLGYYGLDDLTAALLAGNDLKITTIDFQHGPQTNIHMAYTSWTKVPKEGFNTTPVEFWNWDSRSKSNIEEWASTTQNVKSILVGQPFVSYYLNKYKTMAKSDEKQIFYSLQTTPFSIEDMITPKIISLIKKTELKWIFRLHPRTNISLQELNDFLILNNINDKAVAQDAFQTPLPESLVRSFLHVTNYSGCLIEAYLMGIPSLLIHNMGKEMFNLYIDDKKVFFLDQNESNFESDFSTLIENIGRNSTVNTALEVYNPLA